MIENLTKLLRRRRELMQTEVDNGFKLYKNDKSRKNAFALQRAADRVMGYDEAIKIIEGVFNVKVLYNDRRSCENARRNALGGNPMDPKGPFAGEKDQ
jgi:hypothetical protein